ncbi:MAG: hypothetical protein ABI342_00940 [Nitrososphaera sp.]|jgi:uncharacterized membrane protein YqgA involved in biofilm formation
MKLGILVILAGVAVMVSGIVFYLQANSIVGPTYSFMYSNPKWIVNGPLIAIGGILILVAGLGISLQRLRS